MKEIGNLPIKDAMKIARQLLSQQTSAVGRNKTALIDGVDNILMSRMERWRQFPESIIDDVTLSGGENGTVTIINGRFCEKLTAYLKSQKARII